MSEEILVIFRSADVASFYHDFLRIQTEDGEISVPLFGVPDTHDLKLPRYLDFHAITEIGDSAKQTLVLDNSESPVGFSFVIKPLTFAPELEISPTTGKVAAGESVGVLLTYSPFQRCTLRADFEIFLNHRTTPILFSVLASPAALAAAAAADAAPAVAVAEEAGEQASGDGAAPRTKAEREEQQKSDGRVLDETAKFMAEIFGPAEKAEKLRNTRVTRSVGEAPPTESEISQILAERENRENQRRAKELETARSRTETQRSLEPVDEGSREFVADFSGVMMRSSFKMRLAVIDRFARVGTKLIMQLRVQRRLQQLQAALKNAGVRDRTSCKIWVSTENEAAKLRPLVQAATSDQQHWLERALLAN